MALWRRTFRHSLSGDRIHRSDAVLNRRKIAELRLAELMCLIICSSTGLHVHVDIRRPIFGGAKAIAI